MVSIIIPIYNTSQYLDQCINSLLNQTYSDIEIILVDDGSTDNSSDICGKYSKIDGRIRHITQINQGVSVARNTGLHSARGKWVCFVDSDDWVTPDMIDRLLEDADGYDVVLGDLFVAENGTMYEASFFPKKYSEEQKSNKLYLLGNAIGCAYYGAAKNFNIGVPWARIYRKDFILENNLEFPIGVRRMQDTIFNLNVFLKKPKILFCSTPVYYYRVSSGSVCRRCDSHFDEVMCQILCRVSDLLCDDTNPHVRELYIYKRVNLLLEFVALYYGHPECPLSFSAKRTGIRQLFTDDENLVALKKCSRRLLTLKQRIVVCLLSWHLHGTVILLYALKNVITDWKNEEYHMKSSLN